MKIIIVTIFFSLAGAMTALAPTVVSDLAKISRMTRDVMVGKPTNKPAEKLASAEGIQPSKVGPKGDRLCTWRNGTCWATRPTITVTK